MTTDQRPTTNDQRPTPALSAVEGTNDHSCRTTASHSSIVDRPSSDAHFARVEPIVGASLRRARVALIGLPIAAPIVAYLAACGVGRWLWADHRPYGHDISCPDQRPTTTGESCGPFNLANQDALQAYLLAQHGPALALDATVLPPAEWADAIQRDPPDLVIAVGSSVERALALEAATSARIPALLIAPPTDTSPCQVITILPGDRIDATIMTNATAATETADTEEPPYRCLGTCTAVPPCPPCCLPWDWPTAAPLCAGLARAILLRDTPFARADLASLWASGIRLMTVGGVHPLDMAWSAPQQSAICNPSTARFLSLSALSLSNGSRGRTGLQSALFQTPPGSRGALLIVGLGSLGSMAAMHLARCAHTIVIADPDRVDAYNPARQAYPLAAVGRQKAQTLREELLAAGAARVVAVDERMSDERVVAALIQRYAITAALVTTGTSDDFAIGRALRGLDVPHVVGRCYPRARYWEAIVVDGRRGPALADIRGHLRAGPAPAPTPEQAAAYSDAGALEAEPATLVESGWAAAWMARLAAQLLAPAGLRERWLLELLAAGQTCLIGGVGVERTPEGPAYAVAQPGEIRAWARDSIRETRADI